MASTPLYRHSGRVSILGLLAGGGAALAGAPVLAAIYSLAIAYIPFIYLNLILCGLFGAGVGFAVAFAMKMGKVRNTFVVVTAAFCATALAHYVSWMVWVAVMFFRSDVEVPVLAILFPPTFFEIILQIGRDGVWTIGSSSETVSGVALWIVWGIEALIVFGVSLTVAYSIADAEPFCESCESWCIPREDVLRLTAHADSEALRTRLLDRDVDVLGQATRAAATDLVWHQLDLCRCEKCGGTNTLTLSRVILSYDKKGNAQTKKVPLVARMLLDAEQAQWVVGLGAAPPVPAAAPALTG